VRTKRKKERGDPTHVFLHKKKKKKMTEGTREQKKTKDGGGGGERSRGTGAGERVFVEVVIYLDSRGSSKTTHSLEEPVKGRASSGITDRGRKACL